MNFAHEIELEETRKKLRNWGQWANSILDMGQGYSKRSVIGKLIDSKGELTRSTAKKLVPDNEDAEMIDELINKLAEKEFAKARVLRIQYTSDESRQIKILKSKVSKSTYDRYLSNAVYWINDKINQC